MNVRRLFYTKPRLSTSLFPIWTPLRLVLKDVVLAGFYSWKIVYKLIRHFHHTSPMKGPLYRPPS
jgi:hypothetical protein